MVVDAKICRWKGAPTMLSDQEESALRQFCTLVDEIHECRFIQRAREQDHTITIDIDPSKNQLPQYDRDEFRAFATLFRKLVANKEPTQLFKVMKILKRVAPADQKDSFKGIKALLNREAELPHIQIAIGPPDSEVPFTPKKICDVYFNGMVFHSDPELQNDLLKLLDFEPLVMPMFLRYVSIVVNVATQYASVIEHHNYFPDTSAGTGS
jgi:hypothetical protein